MITKQDKETIRKISKRYHVKRVLLFGSSTDKLTKSRDIDIGVEGLPPKDFFRYYGELIFKLSKPVDVIDISYTSKFAKLVKKEGVPLYG